ncbi:DUF885 domain-containing protein [Ekhidna sp.]|uniref:DUF885 domain-containing protein n=1 Tax=Ekhidna sp. TaxID=2608089 RepID=UPI0032982AE6
MRKLLALLFLIGATFVYGQSNEKLLSIIERIDELNDAYLVANPIWQGEHPEAYVFQKIENQNEKVDKLRPLLTALEQLPDEEMTDNEIINRSILVLQLRNEISEIDYKIYLIPFNAEGGFFNAPSFFLPNLPFTSAADYESYFKWLRTFPDFLAYNQGLMKNGIKEKIQAPKIIVKNVLDLLDTWVNEDPTQHPFYRPVVDIPDQIPANERTQIQNQANEIISKKIIPAYQELREFVSEKYLPTAPKTEGISGIKNGKAYYENRVRHFTTLDITPDSVYATGLAEVARIRAQMDQIIADVEFRGSFADFLAFLRTDPQFYPKTGQELLNRAAWLSKKAEGQLPKLFSKLYSLPFTVEPVPDAIAPKYTGGRYVGGSRSQNKPGIYWVNTYNLSSRTLYTLPALSLHEAVPGHHLQITLASELTDLPDYRANYYISAFGEGWGLYSEYLGEEMGMYETPYELFGRYTYEMWRACRLVVDVGLHYKGWTRQQAIDYMAENTALSLHEVTTEIDRYIGWPGQAVSYKMGELTIKNLRAKATDELGESFDIQAFHDAILRNGSVPLPILEKEIDTYILSQKGN